MPKAIKIKDYIIIALLSISIVLSTTAVLRSNVIQGEQGIQGLQGNDGLDGEDGVTPQLKVIAGYLMVSYDDGETWSSLGYVRGNKGETGDDGKDGQNGKNGEDGITPQFQLNDGCLMVSYNYGLT